MAAVLAARPAVASHLSAGWLWDLLRYQPDTVHLTAPTGRRSKRSFVVHAAPLAARDVAKRDCVPVTAFPRTVLDLAGVLSAPQLERVLERAEKRQLFDLGPLEEMLARASKHPGAGKLHRALAIYRPDPAVIRSGLERRFRKLVRAAGLPAPATNFVVGGYELDAYWKQERFAVELDVFETHGSRAAFESDRLRQEDLKLIGVELIRVTGTRLDREPEQVIDRLRTLLARRRAEKRPGRLN
jgi:very-short-patch-repair endonuclease